MGIPNVTRPCAFVFVRSGDRILISEMVDPVEGRFYRPAGGGIEFGETSRDAARRELREELDIDVGELELLGVLENVFTFRGAPYHEICFVFETWVGSDLLAGLNGTTISGTASVDGETARVFELGEFGTIEPIYPEGVVQLLPTVSS
jgi:ADP-ribose pyrophosphatase YjhB (NUDIX family)